MSVPRTTPTLSLEKTAWPELVGKRATLAVQMIVHERPDVAVEVMPLVTTVIPGYNSKRVRLFVNGDGIVDQIPAIG